MPAWCSRICFAARSPSSVCVGGIRMSTTATSGWCMATWRSRSSAFPDCATTSKPDVLEQPRDALAQQHRVLGEDDADGRAARAGAERREAAAEAGLVELEDPLRLGQLRERPEPEVAEIALRA